MRYSELRKSERDKIKNLLFETYGFKMPNDWELFWLGKNRVWAVKEELLKAPIKELNAETIGFYLCYFDFKILRPSIMGAQIIGQTASKNMLEISRKDAEELMKGFDLEKETNLDAEYIILKCPEGIIGVGKNHKTKILCQIKKNRRIRNLN